MTAAVISVFHYNPYRADAVKVFMDPASYNYYNNSCPTMMPAAAEDHFGVVPLPQAFPTTEESYTAMPRQHTSLCNVVRYVSFPSAYAPQPEVATDDLVRLFFGQLPYYITAEQLNYAMQTITNGCSVFFSERIIKRGRPTGCVHGYVHREELEAVFAATKLVLFDDAGFFLAADACQQETIARYCAALKNDQTLRVPSIPYQPMTVEEPKSNFVPRG